MRIEVIVPKKDIIDVNKLMRHIEFALDLAATAAKVDFNTTTSTWNHRPLFLINRARVGERIIYTSDEIYRYVSGGTRVRRVIMTPGFSPKSRFRYIGANQGSGGVMVGPSMKIARPGIKAREFEKEIAEKWEKELPIELQRAIDFVVK